jgi:hypothetical protein
MWIATNLQREVYCATPADAVRGDMLEVAENISVGAELRLLVGDDARAFVHLPAAMPANR